MKSLSFKTFKLIAQSQKFEIISYNSSHIYRHGSILMPVGWGAQQNIQGFGEPPSVKSQVLNLVRSIRTVARFPLIFLNILTIIVKLVLG
ncbi:immediate early response 3-interacting protein 1 isoform X1 [Venturia canescens]|uniref:immediate early response 3-interacting protein 1 isoform X1 n=1 Tax=Venturia canescens TaxID=32260 RepID=UPI001C9D0497|nr:immediate early response 3-interacting protein 1 isoform X1 [Venturia canescens]